MRTRYPGRPWRRPLLATLAVAAMMVLAGCGGDDGGGEGGGEGGQTTLTVGLIPIADVAPIVLGEQQGFFEEQGLQLEFEYAEGGAAITPAVVSGDFDIGFSNTISLLIGSSQGLPLQIISQGVLADENARSPWANLLVMKDGPIKEPEDLEGETIAANTLNNICEVTINASLAEMGVDVEQLQYTEIPFPEMNAALQDGQVAGACVVEPFVTQGLNQGAVGINPFYVNTAPSLTVATYFTTRQFVEENPEAVEGFVTAMEQSLEYASENPDQVRGVLRDYTEIPPEAVEQIELPSWQPELTVDTIQLLNELSVEYGLIEEEVDLDQLISESAPTEDTGALDEGGSGGGGSGEAEGSGGG